MLASSDRLRKREVERLFKKGEFFRQDFITVRFGPNRAGYYRIAIVVGKSASKKATERNRLKRKTSALLEEILVAKKGSFDVMLAFKTLPQEKEIKRVLETIFKRLES